MTVRGIAGVPRWFSRLIAPDTEGFESINLTVGDLTGGGTPEQVILQADPRDEIREVWQDVRVLMVIATAICLCVGGLVYLGLARGLRPLADLEAAFDRLESQDFETRVPEGAVRELDRIHKRFNRMAAVLCAARDRERALASHTSRLPEDLDDTLRVTIYRIVQECLTNVARHAGARHASVRVAVVSADAATASSAGTLDPIAEIQVEDDGKGMAPDTPFGLGLTGIEERVQALGGALTLTKRRRQGLCVRA